MVLLLYVPVVLFFLARAYVEHAGALAPILGIYALGIGIWSLSEYLLHRYLFHYEPTHPTLKWVWYLIHGVHHEQPQCKTRLVMPPILSIPLALLFYGFFWLVVGPLDRLLPCGWASLRGLVTGYIAYDMRHTRSTTSR